MRFVTATLAILLAGSVSANITLTREPLERPRKVIYESRESYFPQDVALKCLKSVVRVNRIKRNQPNGSGSGVVLANFEYQKRYYTYIITNYHVINDCESVAIEQFIYDKSEHAIDISLSYPATILARDEFKDLALIEVKTDIPLMADLAVPVVSEQEYKLLRLYEPAFAIGCGYSESPFITNGNIVSFDTRGGLFHITSPIINGNSGGGAFLRNGKLLAIAKELVVIIGPAGTPTVVTHSGIFIPISEIVKWLKRRELDFVITHSQNQFTNMVVRRDK